MLMTMHHTEKAGFTVFQNSVSKLSPKPKSMRVCKNKKSFKQRTFSVEHTGIEPVTS